MPRLALVLLVLLLPACDALGGDQALFEDEAYGLPPGAATGWRISPALDTRLSSFSAPAPNPASPADFVQLQFFDNEPATGGYALYYLTDQEPRELVLVDQTPGFSQPAFYTLGFFGANVNAGNPGAYRLMVLGAGQRVVAFGDLVIQ